MMRVREIWEAKSSAGWTQQQLGELMGYPAKSARMSVSQWLKSHDTHVSMLRKFAAAVEIPVSDLFTDNKTKRRGKK